MRHLFAELLQHNETHANRFNSRFDDLQASQRPKAVTVCCSDSRVLQDHMWGNDRPGRLFTVGNIGNRVIQRTDSGEVVSGDVLFPIRHTETDLVIVVGHTGCGAVTAAYDDLTDGVSEPAGLRHCLDLISTHLQAGVESLPSDIGRKVAVNRLVEYNVDRQVDHVTRSESIPETITVIGVVYDFQDVYSGRRGEVHVINVDGETDVEELRADHPDMATRIDRLWEP